MEQTHERTGRVLLCEQLLEKKKNGDQKGYDRLKAGVLKMYEVIVHSSYERPLSHS